MKTLAFICVAVTVLWAQTDPLNMTTMQAVRDMGLGINLGNTMEALIVCDPGDSGCENWVNSMETLETTWGSPVITSAMIKGYADAGFETVRIPVAWSNKMIGNNPGGNYTISPAVMNRVEEIVDEVLANGMYAILNIHYDGGWWEKFPTDSAECMKKYKRIWEQVSDRFKNKSGHLVFESLNEEGRWNDVWYIWGSTASDPVAKARAYGILNAINQEFTDLVRASGGNNAARHLLIAGYETNIDRTIDPLFKMPTDAQNRQAVSVHYYDPFGFTHINGDGEWTPFLATWGTPADIQSLNNEMNKLKTAFVDKGIPVIVGEYGFAAKLNEGRGRTQEQVRNYTVAVAKAIYDLNMCPVLWDVQLNPSNGDVIYYYDRNTVSWPDQQLVTNLKAINEVSSSITDSKPLILNSPHSASKYFTIKGEPLGSVKPQNAGVYIEKMNNQTRKILVK
jgi:endoglucanase